VKKSNNRTNCNHFNSKSEKNYSLSNNLELTIYFTFGTEINDLVTRLIINSQLIVTDN